MKSDIFSYGLVLHYMVTGDKPWAAEESHVAGAERMNEALPDYPENFGKGPLNDLYDSCLCWEPKQRPSAGEIINKKFQGKNT
jgi:serine/threonine protein kinase